MVSELGLAIKNKRDELVFNTKGPPAPPPLHNFPVGFLSIFPLEWATFLSPNLLWNENNKKLF